MTWGQGGLRGAKTVAGVVPWASNAPQLRVPLRRRCCEGRGMASGVPGGPYSPSEGGTALAMASSSRAPGDGGRAVTPGCRAVPDVHTRRRRRPALASPRAGGAEQGGRAVSRATAGATSGLAGCPHGGRRRGQSAGDPPSRAAEHRALRPLQSRTAHLQQRGRAGRPLGPHSHQAWGLGGPRSEVAIGVGGWELLTGLGGG